MPVFRIISVLAVVCLATISAAQKSDQLVAERVLGPRWRQMSRASGMIFSGTVLRIEAQTSGKRRPLPLMLTRFRVDRAIAGVHRGEVLTVREWEGAWAMQRAMRRGERVLIFLYAPSRLGLTSPVGGRMGQVALNANGEVPGWPFSPQLTPAAEAGVDYAAPTARLKSCPPEKLPQDTQSPLEDRFLPRSRSRPNATTLPHPVTPCASLPLSANETTAPARSALAQLERAIRNARLKLPTRTEE